MSNNVHSFYQTLLRWQPPDAATLDLGVRPPLKLMDATHSGLLLELDAIITH